MFVGRQEDCNWVLRTKDKLELRCRQEVNIAPRLGNNWEARKRAGCTTRYNLPVACRSLSPKIQRYFLKNHQLLQIHANLPGKLAGNWVRNSWRSLTLALQNCRQVVRRGKLGLVPQCCTPGLDKQKPQQELDKQEPQEETDRRELDKSDLEDCKRALDKRESRKRALDRIGLLAGHTGAWGCVSVGRIGALVRRIGAWEVGD